MKNYGPSLNCKFQRIWGTDGELDMNTQRQACGSSPRGSTMAKLGELIPNACVFSIRSFWIVIPALAVFGSETITCMSAPSEVRRRLSIVT